MKKILAFSFVICMIFAFAACSSQTKNGASADKTDDKVLVVYFSGTGNTRRVAEHIADILEADIYEIEPEEPYTGDDLASSDSNGNSRPALEHNDAAARPAISGSVENMEDYDIVFLGYPIWWGEAPKIMHTFLESYDFSGKTIIPFCTSGNIDIGSSATNLYDSAAGSPEWLDGTRFPSDVARQAIVEWVDELPVKVPANE